MRLALSAPLHVLVDLDRMRPGSGHGGIKTVVFAFLKGLSTLRVGDVRRFHLTIRGERALLPELSAFLKDDAILFDPKVGQWVPIGNTPPGNAAPRPNAPVDVLYSPFGYSPLMESGIPGVALVVDLLHRELPGALPIEEENFRHDQFTRLARQPVQLQCISRYTEECVQRHYPVPAARCFCTAIPVHERLPAHPEGPPPSGLQPGGFFLYPANFWPHKNHETLLIAFRHYVRRTPEPWRLCLTGHRDARSDLIEEMVAGLGLRELVLIPGSLDEMTFASVWAHAGALVFPSLHEGFAIPLLEAMRFRIPILASTIPAIAETAGDAALIADATRHVDFSNAMHRIATDQPLRTRLVESGTRQLGTYSMATEIEKLAGKLERAARPLRS